MRKRIDAKRCVVQKHGAPEETDHKPLPSGNEEAETSDHDCWQDLEFVQPHQLRIGRKIRNFREIGCIVLSMEDPADMTVDEAPVPGRMHILFGIRMQMVMSMLRSPPKDAFLGAALGKEC